MGEQQKTALDKIVAQVKDWQKDNNVCLYRGEIWPKMKEDSLVCSSLYRHFCRKDDAGRYLKLVGLSGWLTKLEQGLIKSGHRHWPDSTDTEILSLFQHYGCPTNLLDFSRDLYIALFFACYTTLAEGGDGRLIVLATDLEELPLPAGVEVRFAEGLTFYQPCSSERVNAQASFFIRSASGYLDPDNERVGKAQRLTGEGISNQRWWWKAFAVTERVEILKELNKYHNIDAESVFADFFGQVRLFKDFFGGPLGEGVQAHIDKDFAKAREKFGLAQKIHSQNSYLSQIAIDTLLLSVPSQREDKLEEAKGEVLEAANNLVKRWFWEPESYLTRVRVRFALDLLEDGDVQEVAADLQRYFELAGNQVDAAAYFWRGCCRLHQQKLKEQMEQKDKQAWEEIQRDFSTYLEKLGGEAYPEAYLRRGYCQFRQGGWPAAVNDFSTYIEKANQQCDPQVYLWRSVCSAQQGDQSTAKIYLQRFGESLGLSPNFEDLTFSIGALIPKSSANRDKAEEEVEKWAQAEQHLSEYLHAVGANAEPDASFLRGYFRIKQMKFEGCEQDFSAYLDLAGAEAKPDAYLVRGGCLFALGGQEMGKGNLPQAQGYCQRAKTDLKKYMLLVGAQSDPRAEQLLAIVEVLLTEIKEKFD